MADATRPSHGQFCWYEVITRDSAKAKAFYAGLFGYAPDDQPMPGGEGTYTLLKLDGQDVAGLFQMDGPEFEGMPPHWMAYMWVDDVDATNAKALSLGGATLMEPMDIPHVGRFAVIADPSGAALGLIHGTGFTGGAGSGNTPGVIGWNELRTSDTQAAEQFLTALFGWTAETQAMGPIVYTSFKLGAQMVGGMTALDPDWARAGTPPHWGQYLTVADCDAAAAKAAALGAEIVAAPYDIPTIGRFAMVKDPTGAYFSVAKWELPTG